MKKDKKDTLSVMEAMEELTRFAELDEKKNVGLLLGKNLEEFEELSDPAHREENQEKVKETFRVLHTYLKQVYEKEEPELEDITTRQGIQAIMSMANEAAQKIDRCTALFKGRHGEEGIQDLKEFKDLQEFYLKKIMKKFHAALAKEEAWEEMWGGSEVDLLDIQRRGLKDLETVKRDKEYELFFIRKEDGNPFFSRNLLRHIKLVGKFDESVLELSGEDPFVRIKAIEDRISFEEAHEILVEIRPTFDHFVKEAVLAKEVPFIAATTKAVMALMLAANPSNLMQNTMGKSSLSYFHDFQLYLREAVETEDYKRTIEKHGEDLPIVIGHAMEIIHALALLFFTRDAHAEESSVFIQALFSRACHAYPLVSQGKNPLWLWSALIDEDEHLRHFLNTLPNGPLLKTIDVMREGEREMGFDPLYQGNLPYQLYSFINEKKECRTLRIPSPTRQVHIHLAKAAPEFCAFLRELSSGLQKRKLLIVNLQDRTSWQEHASCVVLEEIQKNAEFAECCFVVSLPRDTEFFLQSGIYATLEGAEVFKGQIIEQIESGEACGFSFPSSLKMDLISAFAKRAVATIHEVVFGGKEHLTRKNRLDFLELFYHLFVLKLVEIFSPDYFSFVCKDAIDTSAIMAASFYSFLKILGSEPKWQERDKVILYRFLYQASFLLRERAVDAARLHRFVSALSVLQGEIESQKAKLQNSFGALYNEPLPRLAS